MSPLRFRGYKLHYTDRSAAESMIRQIDDFEAFFDPGVDQPRIVDCGANIGVSVLEWKTRWPGSRITCFEPDPFAFAVLQRNLDVNDVPGVQCVQAALFDHEGTASFYGDLSARSDSRGNSLRRDWGKRDNTSMTDVRCVRLRDYLTTDQVSFLKLDVEGVEEAVLRDCLPVLNNVQSILVEVHESASNADNSTAGVQDLLAEAGFQTEYETRFDEHAFPQHLRQWQTRVGAKQAVVRGWR